MSRKTSTTPNSAPVSVTMGAALSSMSNSLPLLDSRRVWSARPTTFPSRKTFFAGFSTGRRVSLFTMSKTRSIDFPRASSRAHPVRDCATGFMKETAPFMSAAITASPMLERVVENHFSLFSRASCAFFRSDSSRVRSTKHRTRRQMLTRVPAKMVLTDRATVSFVCCVRTRRRVSSSFVISATKLRIRSIQRFPEPSRTTLFAAATPSFLRRSMVS